MRRGSTFDESCRHDAFERFQLSVAKPMIPPIERRTHRRLPNHSRVYISGVPSHGDFETTTENISAGGFYCHGPVPLSPGQRIDCIIEIAQPHDSRGGVRLECKAEVMRIVAPGGASSDFGIACQIRQYSVLGHLGSQDRWESSPDSATLPS